MAPKKTNSSVESTAPELVTNGLRLVTDRRALMRQKKIDEIQQNCLDQLELCKFEEEEKRKRIALFEGELNNEIRDTMHFLDQTMAYYDEVLKQHTPPKEKPVDKIVAEIEGEFRKVYEIFAAGFEFKADLPEGYEPKVQESNVLMKAEMVTMEKNIEENKAREEELTKEIAQIRMDIEKEKVKFSAHRLQKEDQTLNYQRKIEALEKKIELLQKPSFEKLQVADLLADVTHLREEIEKTTTAIRSVEEKIRHSMT